MQQQFLITIDNSVTPDFALNFFKNVNFIKTVSAGNEKWGKIEEIDEVTQVAEKSLVEEWLSDEDNRWDKIL